jgi:membrane peptidoglycan carboxypeptidase
VIAVMAVVAGFLVAGITLPFLGVVGLATRDAANAFNNLNVGGLGTPPTRSALYDSEGHVLTYFYPGDVYRVPVTFDQISPVMRNAIVAIEDSPFWTQGALDPRGTLRALFSNSTGGQLQGASTLAQQYVKNVKILQAGQDRAAVIAATYPDLRRKIQQLRMAADVEHQMTQQQLLAAYLNVAFFDNHAWGIQVASEVYFSEKASQLTLPQAALLAGIVQSPTAYDPLVYPGNAKMRRNEVLARMAQLGYISHATATATEQLPIKLHMSSVPLQTGCFSPQVAASAYFCDYVKHVLEINYKPLWKAITTTGGLSIYTTLNRQDQLAAYHAVTYVQPGTGGVFNPNHDADSEVLIQPGTGAVRAIAIDRRYGTGPGENSIDYAVNWPYGGDKVGVQTGSSSKVFTLVTALEQGVPFGHKIKVASPTTIGGFTNCQGTPLPPYAHLSNSEGPSGAAIWPLYSATVDSINVYFGHLEQQVGLCNVVKTAAAMGMTRADGTSLLKNDKALGTNGVSADNITSFTLGSVGVSPMSMAAAYATVAARGVYCAPKVISKIVVVSTGQVVHPQQTKCHRAIPQSAADAANFVFQGVLTQPGATAVGRGIGRPAAAKTGTSDKGHYAAFAGWTPTLAGYVSVFNPLSPTNLPMIYPDSCYHEFGLGSGVSCPSQMFGDNAPGATWEYTFTHAQLGPPLPFAPAPRQYFSEGTGAGGPQQVKKPKPPPKRHGGGPGPAPSPSPTKRPRPRPKP